MNMNQASTTLVNNKHKLQCGGQHASTKAHEICKIVYCVTSM